jgi:hypothetical protein
MGSATAARDDVVDVLRLRPAVLTPVPVAYEDRTARDRDAGLVGHAYVINEPDYGRLGEFRPGGVKVLAGPVKEFGLVREH